MNLFSNSREFRIEYRNYLNERNIVLLNRVLFHIITVCVVICTLVILLLLLKIIFIQASFVIWKRNTELNSWSLLCFFYAIWSALTPHGRGIWPYYACFVEQFEGSRWHFISVKLKCPDTTEELFGPIKRVLLRNYRCPVDTSWVSRWHFMKYPADTWRCWNFDTLEEHATMTLLKCQVNTFAYSFPVLFENTAKVSWELFYVFQCGNEVE